MLKEVKINTSSHLIKQIPKAIAYVNKKLEIIHASDILGFDYNKGNTGLVNKSLPNLFGNLDKKITSLIKNTISKKKENILIERLVNENAKDLWLEFVSIPWFDEDQNLIGAIIRIANRTEKIENAYELQKFKILAEEKSEITKIGSWEYNAVKDELYWCNMTKKIHNVPLNFIPEIETAIDFYKPGFSKNTIAMKLDDAMQNGTSWSQKLQIVTLNGQEKWIISSGKPLFENNKFIGLIGTIQDIEEKTHIEEKTKKNEQLLETLINNLPLNVFIKDLDSRKILVNKSECDYTGLEEKDILGKNDFELYPKEYAQQSRDEDLKVMNSLKSIIGKEKEIVTNDGIKTNFLTSKIPLIDDEGIATGLIGLSLDITQIKQKENELKNLINVTSLQNKKLINFAHIVSHNLRSHSANFSMLLDFLVNEKCEKEKESLITMLVGASDNLLETLDNLNDVVAINTNLNLDKKPVCLNDKIEAVQKNLAAFIINNAAQVNSNVPKGTLVKAVPAYIESILMNFITNAVKYKSDVRFPVINLTVERKDNYTVLSIQDNGIGIDLEKYGDKLFGMYKTFHNNVDARGIGLYITKNQIEAMGGKIEVNSKVNIGTTFKIYFNEQD